MSGKTSITRYLPDNEYQAAISSNAPSSLNPFATIADITASSQNLQQVMDVGSSASVGTAISLISSLGGVGQLSITGSIINLALGGANLLMTSTSNTFNDSINNKGLIYGSDYSANGVLDPRWIPDYGAVINQIGGKSVSALVKAPLLAQDGYAVTWDNTAGKYTLTSSYDGNGIYTGSASLSVPTTVTMGANPLTFSGNDFKVTGLTDANLFLVKNTLDYVSMGNNTLRVSNVAIGGNNVNIASSTTPANGATVNISNTSVSSTSSLTITRSGGGFAALYIYTTSASAINIGNGEILGGNTSYGISLGSGFGFDASSRIESIVQGSYIEGYRASLYKTTGNQVGYYVTSNTNSSTGGTQIGLKVENFTGTALISYGSHITMTAIGVNSATDTYGSFVDWNGNGSNQNGSGRHTGFFTDMRSTSLNSIFTGKIFGFDIQMGAGSSTITHSGIVTGGNIIINDILGATVTKNIGLNIDLTLSKATASYGLIVNGANSGFGTNTPASMVTVNGDLETVGNGLGLIVADAVTGTRYRVYMNNGVLTTQLA